MLGLGKIDRSQVCDKLGVVCSENSLQSGPVFREIERGLQREDRERSVCGAFEPPRAH